MSYGLWRRRFGGDPAILGKIIALGGAPYTVIGIISPGFKPYHPAEVWIPLQADPNSTNQASTLTAAARLPDGMTLARANSEMAVIAERYSQTHLRQIDRHGGIQVSWMEEQITGDARPALLILLGAVGLVLLIACANVANLLLARAASRQREIGIRSAIGAGRGRIVRQLLTESVLLSLTGGVLGLALGSWGVRALLALAPGDLPRIQEMAAIPALDPWVAGFTASLAVVTGLLFGVFPAIQLSRVQLSSSVRHSSEHAGTGPKNTRTRGALVAAEVAITVVLLCGALLLIRSFVAMHAVNLGFDQRSILTMEFALAGPRYAKADATDLFARQFVGRAEAISGVDSAAVASALPLFGYTDMIFDIPGRSSLQGHRFAGDVQWRFVSAHYFDVLHIPLLSGRLFRDREPGRTVVVSQTMARRMPTLLDRPS
jgi:predicted permease